MTQWLVAVAVLLFVYCAGLAQGFRRARNAATLMAAATVLLLLTLAIHAVAG